LRTAESFTQAAALFILTIVFHCDRFNSIDAKSCNAVGMFVFCSIGASNPAVFLIQLCADMSTLSCCKSYGGSFKLR